MEQRENPLLSNLLGLLAIASCGAAIVNPYQDENYQKITSSLAIASGTCYLFLANSPIVDKKRQKFEAAQLSKRLNKLKNEITIAQQQQRDLQQQFEARKQAEIAKLKAQKQELEEQIGELEKKTQNFEQIRRESAEKELEAVLEGVKAAHNEEIQEILAQKDEILAEVERLQGLQERTEAAIAKKKQELVNEHANFKAQVIKNAEKMVAEERIELQRVISNLQGELELLKTENAKLIEEIEGLNKSVYPDSYDYPNNYAHGLIKVFEDNNIFLRHIGAFPNEDESAVFIRVDAVSQTTTVGVLTKYSDRLQRHLKLVAPPFLEVRDGYFQFILKPRFTGNRQLVPDSNLLAMPNTVNVSAMPVIGQQHTLTAQNVAHPRIITQAQHLPIKSNSVVNSVITSQGTKLNLSPEDFAFLNDFIPPQERFMPNNPVITEDEKNWILRLWFIEDLRSKSKIAYQVYRNRHGGGVRPGGSTNGNSVYANALRKIENVLTEAGIQIETKKEDISNGNVVEEKFTDS